MVSYNMADTTEGGGLHLIARMMKCQEKMRMRTKNLGATKGSKFYNRAK